MSHELDTSTGQVGMAYVGDEPWHGLGHKLQPGAAIETWRKAAGLDWSVLEDPIYFNDRTKAGNLTPFIGQKALYRDDTGGQLAIVSTGYNPVQPGEVLTFMEKMMAAQGLHLETAGSIRDGKRIWALAKAGEGAQIVDGDVVRPYLLVATSYDKSMATTVKRTKIRVVCNNTLTAAAGDHQAAGTQDEPELKVYHSEKFDPDKVAGMFEQVEADFRAFVAAGQKMAQKKVGDSVLDAFLLSLYKADQTKQEEVEKVRKSKGYKRIAEMFQTGDNNPGADMAGKTLWGLVNSVTRYIDFERGASRETGLDSAWFGEGNALKNRAFDIAQELAEA